jgi:hypothetical protein
MHDWTKLNIEIVIAYKGQRDKLNVLKLHWNNIFICPGIMISPLNID